MDSDNQQITSVIAHSRSTQDGRIEVQLLSDHLSQTAEKAARFAAPFGGQDWAYLAGLWHDLGKSSTEFQEYIRAAIAEDSHQLETRGKVDHSTAGAQYATGAQYAADNVNLLGHIIAYAIAGHHAGLLDGMAVGACQWKRLRKSIPSFKEPSEPVSDLNLPPQVADLAAEKNMGAFTLAFFTRMVFSCLVDADFLDTEAFVDGDRAASRPTFPTDIISRMERVLDEHIASFRNDGSEVTKARRSIHKACLDAAQNPPGFFSLTVPTGGGKTLSSLAFALRHIEHHGLSRVIYAIPFTSIIEQNADVFRDVMDSVFEDVVLEHHCNVQHDPDKDRTARLATENWDAPLVVTTTVQLYESLFANRPSRCRKLHNIAGSVVILDEVQSIPVDLLEPILRALEQLVGAYGVSVVLCTATQPAVTSRQGFEIGIGNVTEIIPDPVGLYQSLERVEAKTLGLVSDEELVEKLTGLDQVLCIVNTRGHARNLFEMLGNGEGTYHLSAQMCPSHRTQVLKAVRDRLDRGASCRLISTQLIEAGVDIDFPVVYRSMAGLDSIAQAAGRCNRNGKLPERGRLFVFESEHKPKERFLADVANVAEQILPMHDNPLGLNAVDHYFRLYYWEQNKRWDARGIMGMMRTTEDPQMPFLFDFKTIATTFRLIDQTAVTVFVPLETEGKQLCERLRHGSGLPPRDLLQKLQRYQVGISERAYLDHLGKEIELVHDRFAVLVDAKLNYREETGLDLDHERRELINY